MADNVALFLRPSVKLDASGWVNNFFGYKTHYRRSIRLNGGYWAASWELSIDSGLTAADLRQWFYEYLGFHIQEKVGNLTTWEGMLYELELIENGVHRVRTLDLLNNAIMSLYTDVDSDDEPAETSWATSAESIARYGRKENIITLDKYDQTIAEGRRDSDLKIYAWPWARPVGSGESQPAVLKCKALGYIHTMNWRYITAVLDAGAEGNLSDYLAEIIDTDCEFLDVGKITENTLQVIQTVDYEQAWDWIEEKVALGDGSEPWHIQVVNDRKVIYKELDWSPIYYWRKGQIYNSAGLKQEVNPYLVKPAVCRDMSYPVRGKEYGSPYNDKRDFMLEEVEVGEESGLKFKTLEFDEAEFMAGVDEYQHWLEEERTEGKDEKGKRGEGHRKWRWGSMTDEEKEDWDEVRKRREEKAKRKKNKKK